MSVTRERRRGVVFALGLATALTMTGCGDDKDSASQTTTTVPATTTTLSQVQLDKKKAQRVVLTASDVPGYTTDVADASDDDPDLDAAGNACTNNNALLKRLGEDNDERGAGSPDFSKGETTTVGSSVTFAETDDQARTAIADLGAASVPTCLSKAFVASFKKDPGFTNVTVTGAKLPALTVADQSIGYRFTIKFRAEGQSLTAYSDVTFIRSGRGVAEFDTNTFSTTFPEAERVRLVTVIAGRMAAP